MMEYCKYAIIKESVKFLNNCHKSVIDGEISVEYYKQLVGNKFSFLNEILKEEEGNDYVPRTLKTSNERF